MKRKRTQKKALFRHNKLGQSSFSGHGFKSRLFFGGSFCTTRAHRIARPISTKYPIHLILKSSQAKGDRSFWAKPIANFIKHAIKTQAARWGIEVLSFANVGNHFHLFIKLKNRYAYERFIRGLTGAISLKLTKWNNKLGERKEKFWDFRPYTRIVVGFKARITMDDYMTVNQLQGLGCTRAEARMLVIRGLQEGFTFNTA